jgi:hypothetical protein
VTGEVKAAVEVEVEVEPPSIDHSYTDLLAVTLLYFVVVVRRKVWPIPLRAEINAADN